MFLYVFSICIYFLTFSYISSTTTATWPYPGSFPEVSREAPGNSMANPEEVPKISRKLFTYLSFTVHRRTKMLPSPIKPFKGINTDLFRIFRIFLNSNFLMFSFWMPELLQFDVKFEFYVKFPTRNRLEMSQILNSGQEEERQAKRAGS